MILVDKWFWQEYNSKGRRVRIKNSQKFYRRSDKYTLIVSIWLNRVTSLFDLSVDEINWLSLLKIKRDHPILPAVTSKNKDLYLPIILTYIT